MSTQTKVPQLPAIPKGVDSETRRWMESVKQVIEVREGTRGKSLDQSVTFRDLMDADVDISMLGIKGGPKPGSGATGSSTGGTDGLFPPGMITPANIDPIPYAVIPPGLTWVGCYGGVGLVLCIWENPRQLYRNHAHTEVWRSKTNDLSKAGLVGTAYGERFTDKIDEVNTDDPDGFYYYWIRAVSTRNPPTYGPFAGPEWACDNYQVLSNKIKEGHLFASLGDKIVLIEDMGFDFELLDETGELDETLIRTEAGRAVVLHVTQLKAITGVNQAGITTLDYAVTNPDGAVAQSIKQLRTEVGEDYTTLEVFAKVKDGVGGEYSVKIDNNGSITGFGLISEYDKYSTPESTFIIRADRFAVAPPSNDDDWSSTDEELIPFMVGKDPKDGKYKVYIKSAVIGDAIISDTHISLNGISTSHLTSGTIRAEQSIEVGNDRLVLRTLTGAGGQLVAYDAKGNPRCILGSDGNVDPNDPNSIANYGLQILNADGELIIDASKDGTSITKAFIADLWVGGFKATVPAGSYTDADVPIDLRQNEQTIIQTLNYDPQGCDRLQLQIGFEYDVFGNFETSEINWGSTVKIYLGLYAQWNVNTPLWSTLVGTITREASLMGGTVPAAGIRGMAYFGPQFSIKGHEDGTSRYELKIGVVHSAYSYADLYMNNTIETRKVWHRSLSIHGLRSITS